MRVAVDVDGVLLDLMEIYCEIFNEIYNETYQKCHVNRWDFFKNWNIDEEDAFGLFFDIYESVTDIPLIDENAPEILQKVNRNHTIDIVSARTGKYKENLKKNLEFHQIFEGIHYNQLILVNHKPYDIKIRYSYDIYIDDNPHLAKKIPNSNKKILLLYNQPWNQEIILDDKVIRVNNWNEIFKFFKNLKPSR